MACGCRILRRAAWGGRGAWFDSQRVIRRGQGSAVLQVHRACMDQQVLGGDDRQRQLLLGCALMSTAVGDGTVGHAAREAAVTHVLLA